MYIEKGSLSSATTPLLNDALDAVDALAEVKRDAGLNRGVSACSRAIIVPRSGVVKGRSKKKRVSVVRFLDSQKQTQRKSKKSSPVDPYRGKVLYKMRVFFIIIGGRYA